MANCGKALKVLGTNLNYVSELNYYGVGASVKYTCINGYIAKERDAIGNWIVGYYPSKSLISTCQNNGRWDPRPLHIQCIGSIEIYYTILKNYF